MSWNPFRRRVHECCEVETLSLGPVGTDTHGTLIYDDTHVEFIGVIIDPNETEDVYGHALDAARDTLQQALRDGPDLGPAPATT